MVKSVSQKTDNSNLDAKLALRRYFLKKYHDDGNADVLDCCQGAGLLWNRLRSEHAIRSYWGVDIKPRRGRLKIDSVRILMQPGWTQDVIDIDTYGSPWKHWEAMLPNVTTPVTVFLTAAWLMSLGFKQYSREAIRAVGIGENIRKIAPPTLLAFITKQATQYTLATCYDFNLRLEEVRETMSRGNARYIGVRLVPVTKQATGASGGPNHTTPVKEASHG